MNVASKVNFNNICLLLNAVADKSGHNEKRKVLHSFMQKWRAMHSEMHKSEGSTSATATTMSEKDSFYPAMRLLLPQCDNKRVYGMKENVLARLYIDVLSIGKTTVDGRSLLTFKNPGSGLKSVGDFAETARKVLRDRCADTSTLTVAGVNDILDAIAVAYSEHKKDEIRRHLLQLIRTSTCDEQKWLIRIILKDLKVGVSQKTVLEAFHPDADRYYMQDADLARLCERLADTATRGSDVEIQLFHNFLPQLAARVAVDRVAGAMEHRVFYVETKLDGERMQLHKEGSRYAYWSRRGKQFTDAFGGSPSTGSLTPYIHERLLATDSCILDGEMIGYNPHTADFVCKSADVGFDVKTSSIRDDVWRCFCAFDILLYNGRRLANLPLRERLELLGQVVRDPLEGRLMLVHRVEARSNEEVVAELNDAIDHREEGIIVKKPDSVYACGARNQGGWFKIKPDYIDSVCDTIDCIIVGGYFGEGKRRKIISHFLCALLEESAGDRMGSSGVNVGSSGVNVGSSGLKSGRFLSFVKLGSGYTYKELYGLGLKLANHWNVYKRGSASGVPESLVLGRETPDVWVDPRVSVCVEVKAAEVSRSDRFASGFTLRFPRLERVRDDKRWWQCATVAEVAHLRDIGGGKLARRLVADDAGIAGPPAKKQRRQNEKRNTAKPKVTLAAHFRAADLSNVKEVGNFLEGKEFCVVNVDDESDGMSKVEMEKGIAENGGTVSQHPNSHTYCVVAHFISARIKNIISRGCHNVVRSHWLAGCLREGRLEPWDLPDLVHCLPATRRLFDRKYDRFGDSFTRWSSLDSIRGIINGIGDQSELTRDQVTSVEWDLFGDSNPYGLFRHGLFLVQDSLDVTAVQLRYYGGIIATKETDGITHVVIDGGNKTGVEFYRGLNRNRRGKGLLHIVTPQWVDDCLSNGRLVDERSYIPK